MEFWGSPQITGKLLFINPPKAEYIGTGKFGKSSHVAFVWTKSITSEYWPFSNGYPVVTNTLPRLK